MVWVVLVQRGPLPRKPIDSFKQVYSAGVPEYGRLQLTTQYPGGKTLEQLLVSTFEPSTGG